MKLKNSVNTKKKKRKYDSIDALQKQIASVGKKPKANALLKKVYTLNGIQKSVKFLDFPKKSMCVFTTKFVKFVNL